MKKLGIILFFFLGIIPAFSQEITIIEATADTADVIWKDGSREPWIVYGGAEITTSTIDVHFKYRKKGRTRDLHYDVRYVDSLDSGEWKFDLIGDAEEAILVESGGMYQLRIIYPDKIFYFAGKVL